MPGGSHFHHSGSTAVSSDTQGPWKWYCFSTECRQHWGFSAPKSRTPAFLAEQKCLLRIVLTVRFTSYLASSQQVTNWLCTRCIKTCKPDALTLNQKSISRLSSPADFWTFIKCLCLYSSVVSTHSGWAGFQLYHGLWASALLLRVCLLCPQESPTWEKRPLSPPPYNCTGPGASQQPQFLRLMRAQEVRIKQACTSLWQTWALLRQHLTHTALDYPHSPLHPHESEFSLVQIHSLEEFFSFFSLKPCLLLPSVVRRGEGHFQGSVHPTYAYLLNGLSCLLEVTISPHLPYKNFYFNCMSNL